MNEAIEYGIEDLTEDGLSAVAQGAAALKAALAVKERLDEELKLANANILRISTEELPAAMRKLGLDALTLSTGERVEVKEEISAGLTEKTKAAAFEWLRRTGNESLIKRCVTVEFGRGQDAVADRFTEEARAALPDNAILDEPSVHAGTLKAFVRERLAYEKELAAEIAADSAQAGPVTVPDALPRDVFGVFILNRAKLKAPKKEQ